MHAYIHTYMHTYVCAQVVPTAAASYNASYTDAHLRQLADTLPVPPALSYLIPLLHTIQCSPSRGYSIYLLFTGTKVQTLTQKALVL